MNRRAAKVWNSSRLKSFSDVKTELLEISRSNRAWRLQTLPQPMDFGAAPWKKNDKDEGKGKGKEKGKRDKACQGGTVEAKARMHTSRRPKLKHEQPKPQQRQGMLVLSEGGHEAGPCWG